MKFGAALSKDLRERHHRRSFTPRVGDSVKIVRGEFKGIEGKVTMVFPGEGRLNVEGVTRDKIKGGTSPVGIQSSNVVITSLTLDDKLRAAKLEVGA
ncbi:MAG: 50S ribosomal protein L24 [Thaumarchaeota archaeon]|nr:50S ribosomal protein L24 [Nitrososphaerota archaeon]